MTEPLDGNAAAGALRDYFGAEMTTAAGECRHCGTRALIAELTVYCSGPGTVLRCRACGDVVIVIVETDERLTVDHRHYALARGRAGG